LAHGLTDMLFHQQRQNLQLKQFRLQYAILNAFYYSVVLTGKSLNVM
jgi:hypothetical protein